MLSSEGMSKPNPEFEAFTNLLRRLVAVPHEELQRRIAEHRKQAAKNPRKRGPKPKPTSGVASRDSRAEN
jgi:hypothetical protein